MPKFFCSQCLLAQFYSKRETHYEEADEPSAVPHPRVRGAAGIGAASNAKDAGASVLLQEKQARMGGNTMISGSLIYATGTSFQMCFTTGRIAGTNAAAQQ